MTNSETRRAIDAVWRIESARLIAGLTRIVQDVGLAEELAQDALVAALEQWPESGVPDNPGAWLMGTAKHRAIDVFRRQERLTHKVEQLGRDLETHPDMGTADLNMIDDDIGDDLLRLVFMTCHPVLSTDAQVALTLRLLGGLTTEEIGLTLRVKGVIYLIFNEGYAATTGGDWTRPALCEDALRLGRILAELSPHESEVHGLVALMEIQASRTRARTSRTGEPVLLLDQDRASWDHILIQRGLQALERASQAGTALGPYALQAAIAACHARARVPEETDWTRISALYDALSQVAPSPVVELNRAVALSMAFGPAVGLELVDTLASERSLNAYHLLPSVRGDLLAKLGRSDEARAEFERAASLTRNAREQKLLLDRAAAMEAESRP